MAFVEKFCVRSIKVFLAAVLGLLCLGAAFSTFRMPADYTVEAIYEYGDSPWKNLLAAVFVLALVSLVKKWVTRDGGKGQRRLVRILALGTIALVGVLLAAWVTVSPILPYWDQLQVYYNALDFRSGDFSAIGSTYYCQMYVQQYGLILVESVLLTIWESYRVVQYANVLFLCLILFFVYRIADELFEDAAASLLCLWEAACFVPMHLYVTYVYGDVCSIALCLACAYGLLRWEKGGKPRYLVMAGACSVVAVLVRMNSIIFLIAAAIVCVLSGLRRKKARLLAVGVLVVALPLLSSRAVVWGYEAASGQEIGDGMPAQAWIAMGLQDQPSAAGTFNGYSEHLWGKWDGDAGKVREESQLEIRARLASYLDSPRSLFDFFRRKALEQWAEPSYSSLSLTGRNASQLGSPLTDAVYSAKAGDLLCRVFNYFQFAVYFFSLYYVLASFRQEEDLWTQLCLLAVLGGFLFSLLWEAKGRYVLSYVVFLFPYAAQGSVMASRRVGEAASAIRKALQKPKGNELLQKK